MACAMALADNLEPSVATRICLYIAPPAVESGPILCRDLRVVAESRVRQFTAQALPSGATMTDIGDPRIFPAATDTRYAPLMALAASSLAQTSIARAEEIDRA